VVSVGGVHTEREIRDAVGRAGCRVIELRRVDTKFGPVWYGKHSCPDNPATFRLLLEIAGVDEGDAAARTIALDFVRRFPKDKAARARAIHEWVKANVLYVREPKETFQSPSYTMRSGAGDCDDHANLVNAIAKNAGLSSRIVPILKPNGDVKHAVTQIELGGAWLYAETTVEAQFGEDPKAAVRRLAVARDDIAAGIGETPVLTGVRVLLHQGTTYRARARVDAPSFLVSKGMISSRLEDEGFANVVVYKDPTELPADWPQDERATVGGFTSFTAFIEAAWPKPDEARAVPEQVIAAWVHKRPPCEDAPVIHSGPEGSHAWAREIVRLAWAYNFHETPNEPTAQAVQAIALHEAGYGFALKTPDGAASHNWGSIQCGSGWKALPCDCSNCAPALSQQTCPPGCFAHVDRDAKGACYIGCYKQYAEPVLGARDFVHVLCGVASRKRVRDVIGYGNATVIAREMRASGYFEATVASYAQGIGNRAKQIAVALREPVYVEPSNWIAGLASVGIVAGTTWLALRRDIRA